MRNKQPQVLIEYFRKFQDVLFRNNIIGSRSEAYISGNRRVLKAEGHKIVVVLEVFCLITLGVPTIVYFAESSVGRYEANRPICLMHPVVFYRSKEIIVGDPIEKLLGYMPRKHISFGKNHALWQPVVMVNNEGEVIVKVESHVRASYYFFLIDSGRERDILTPIINQVIVSIFRNPPHFIIVARYH